MAKRIGIDLEKISKEYQEYKPFNSSFRIISDYIPATDSLITAITVKFSEEEQYTVAFVSSALILSGDHRDNRNDINLVSPKFGIEGLFNIRTNKDHVIAALKELVSDLENS